MPCPYPPTYPPTPRQPGALQQVRSPHVPPGPPHFPHPNSTTQAHPTHPPTHPPPPRHASLQVRCSKSLPICSRCKRLDRECVLRHKPDASVGRPRRKKPKKEGVFGTSVLMGAHVAADPRHYAVNTTLILMTLDPGVCARHLFDVFHKYAPSIVFDGDSLYWVGDTPPAGPLSKPWIILCV